MGESDTEPEHCPRGPFRPELSQQKGHRGGDCASIHSHEVKRAWTSSSSRRRRKGKARESRRTATKRSAKTTVSTKSRPLRLGGAGDKIIQNRISRQARRFSQGHQGEGEGDPASEEGEDEPAAGQIRPRRHLACGRGRFLLQARGFGKSALLATHGHAPRVCTLPRC